ncbi:RNA polymerase sigma factor [Leucobacter musarum]|uniref:RNA polymerase sigma factor n=1 Tax=Leucobacter musarum TaxID=1930747 RepID=UPI000949783D|nr:sigma-70 family RNA polymerase sigma factor [Leucobacter musarum]
MRSSYVQSDAEIIASAREQPEAFTELYRRHAAAVFRYAISRLGREAADDIVAETFLVAFERRDTYDVAVPGALPWVLGIATRLIRRRRRQEADLWRLVSAVGGIGGDGTVHSGHDPSEGIDSRLDADTAVRSIAATVARLPKRDRDVLMLSAWSELDSAGIATALGIPEGTARSRLHRVRRILRTQLAAGAAREVENTDEQRNAARRTVVRAPSA